MPSSPNIYIGKQTVQKHIDQALAEIIQPDETLLGVFHGQALSGDSYGLDAKHKGGFSLHDYLLVTDQRVVMWARGVFSGSTDGFHYDDIAGVEEARGLLLGEIVLNIRGAKERMRSMVKEDVPRAAQMIRERISNSKTVRRTPATVRPPLSSVYIIHDGRQEGPFDEEQIRQKIIRGEYSLEALAWHEGIDEWQPISAVTGIRLPPPPPTVPAILPPPVPAVEVLVPPLPTPLPATFMLRTCGTFKRKQGGPYTEAEVRQLLKSKIYRSVDRAMVVGDKRGKWQPIYKVLGEKLPAADARRGCLGCAAILLIIIVAIVVPANLEKKKLRNDFAENRNQILKQVKAAAEAGAHERVVELANTYEFIHDPELDRYLSTSRAELKANEERERAARSASEDATDGPWVPRVRGLTAGNAEAAGQSDGFNAVTQYVIKSAYSAGNSYELRSGLQDFKNTALASYDQLAAKHELDMSIYNAYRRGWENGFDANASTASMTTR